MNDDFLQDVQAVYERIEPYIRKTPLLYSDHFSDILGCPIYFKLENIQHTGSFKVRGALSKVLSLSKKERTNPLVTASGGNHGLGVCYAGNQVDMHTIVYLPINTPSMKIQKIKSLGGEVMLHGDVWDEANERAMKEAGEKDMIYVHPFSDEDVMRGQGTIAHEILSELPEIDLIICSIGGGGLISGIARYAKAVNSSIKVYGVETKGADAMYQSITADKIVTLPAITSIAESLAAKRVTEKSFHYVKHFVDGLSVVSDSQALETIIEILQHEKQLVEPAASCNLAALLTNQIPDFQDKTIAIVLCGGNFPVEELKPYL
jgi:threonine dehydratase